MKQIGEELKITKIIEEAINKWTSLTDRWMETWDKDFARDTFNKSIALEDIFQKVKSTEETLITKAKEDERNRILSILRYFDEKIRNELYFNSTPQRLISEIERKINNNSY